MLQKLAPYRLDCWSHGLELRLQIGIVLIGSLLPGVPEKMAAWAQYT